MPGIGAFFSGLSSFFATGVVAGAGIGGAWAAGAAFGSFLTSTVVGRLLTSVALSALSRALAPKPKQPGVRTNSTMVGGANSDAFVLGWYASSGQLVCPPMSHGKAGRTPNAYLTYVIEVGAPGQGLDSLILDGEPVTLGTTPHEDGYGLPVLGRFEGQAWVKYYDGTQTAADAMLVEKYGDYERPWTAQHVGSGIAYAVLTFKYDREVFSSFPKVRFVLHGVKLYDPRLDSTAGGAGAQRWADPATWAVSTNPMVMVYNILRGITLPGGHVWGGECVAEDLPYAAWAAAMAKCDELHDGAARYRAGYEVLVEDEPYSVIEELLTACGGQLAEIGGEWVPAVGAPDLPVLFISDDDVIVTEADEFEPFPSPEATYNGASASFPRPSAIWEASEIAPIYFPALEAEDGGRRLMASLQMNACPYPKQVRRVAREAVKDSRRWRRHSIALPPEAAVLQPLDTISWTSARNGYVGKTFEVVEVARDPRGALVSVVLRERDPSDYDFVAETLPTPPSVLPVRPASQAVPGWSVSGIAIIDGTGAARRAALQFGWNAAECEDATGIRWEVRRSGDTALVLRGSTQDVEAGQLTVSDGVLAGVGYEARARLILRSRRSAWSSWLSAVTPAVLLGRDDVDFGGLDAAVAGLEAWADSTDEALATRNAQVDADLAALSSEITTGIAQVDADLAALSSEITTGIADLRGETETALTTLWDEDIAPLIERVDEQIPRLVTVEDALDEAYDRLLEAQLQVSFLRKQGADAGIYIDPATGQVLIAGVQTLDNRISSAEIAVDGVAASIELRATYAYVNQAVSNALMDPTQIPIVADLELQVSQVQIDLDAQAALIALKADALTVSGLDARITAAEVDIDGLNAEIALRATTTDLTSVSSRVSAAEVLISALDVPTISLMVQDVRSVTEGLDAAELATLEDLLRAYNGLEVLREATASAQLQLMAEVSDRFVAEASARLAVQSDLDGFKASAGVLYYTKAEVGQVVASATTSLRAEMEGPTGSVGSLSATLANSYYTRTQTDSAISSATTALRASMEGASGSIGQINAALTTSYYTRAQTDSAISTATTTLKSQMEGATGTIGQLYATLTNSYYTRAQTNSAISGATTTLRSEMEAPTGSVGQVTADLANNYFTRAQTNSAISTATTTLKSQLEGPSGSIGQINAALTTSYYTRAQTDSAISTATTTLKSQMEGASGSIGLLSADLKNNYYTRAQTNSAISGATTTLRSEMEAPTGSVGQVTADLANNYFTRAQTNSAISTATTTLKSQLEGPSGSIGQINAALTTSYYTRAQTDSAISTATTTLRSQMEGASGSIGLLSADLKNNYYTRVSTDGAISDAITALDASYGRYNASGLLRITTEANAGGALSRIALKAAATAGEGTTRSAALYLEAVSGGTSRIVLLAEQTAVLNGATREPLLVADASGVYLAKARIREADIDTLKIDGNAVTVPSTQTNTAAVAGNGAWQQVNSLTFSMPEHGQAVIIWTGAQFYGKDASPGVGVRIKVNGTVVSSRITGDAGDYGIQTDWLSYSHASPVGKGSNTVAVEWFGGTSDLTLRQRTLTVLGAMR